MEFDGKNIITIHQFAQLCRLSDAAIKYWIKQGVQYFQNMSIRYLEEPYTFERGTSPASIVFIFKCKGNPEYEEPINLQVQEEPIMKEIDGNKLLIDSIRGLQNSVDSMRLDFHSILKNPNQPQQIAQPVQSNLGGVPIAAIIASLPTVIGSITEIVKLFKSSDEEKRRQMLETLRAGMEIGLTMKEESEEEEPEEPKGNAEKIEEFLTLLKTVKGAEGA